MKYIVLYGIGSLLDDYTFINGNTGTEALSNHFTDSVGIFKRENMNKCDYILQKVVVIDGKEYRSGKRTGYRYIKPRIERIV